MTVFSGSGSWEGQTPIDFDFEGLAALQLDPVVGGVIHKTREYNELLASEYVRDEEIHEIVTELDTIWLELLGEIAEYTGYALFKDENSDDEDEPIRSYYEEQSVQFRGIVAQRVAIRSVDTGGSIDILDDSGGATESIFELRVGITREGIDAEGNLLQMSGSFGLDDMIRLEFDHIMSVERAQKILQYLAPELIDDIDVRLLNPSLEECEMVMRLADLSLDLQAIGKMDEEQTSFTMGALANYTNSLFSFDEDVPYIVYLDGQGWSLDEVTGSQAAMVQAGGLVKIERILWISAPSDEDEVVRPAIEMYYLADDKDTPPPHHLIMPIDTIVGFRSVRHEYVYGYDN